MKERKTFVYLLLACSWSRDLESQLSDWYYGDIIEAFIESEDQARRPEDLWAFGWEEFMARITPVQLTLGWDPRPYIISIFANANIEPYYRLGYFEEHDNILYFDKLPPKWILPSATAGIVPNPPDKIRFDKVLLSTIELARSLNRGLLFIGGWGWDYDMDIPREVEPILRQAGMQFFTRHA
ncbi:hypothetical protein Q2T83_16020 [Fervidibacter sacchari]|uniref:Uncharacterized protein n=1 Tax=Candidatus Fervidibacter sacchari TaxID=1448929 RepID=A0ABT2EM36_9BACT|nr:hypothetical protein [Candidatus Fervidibacter sacchari]MCS3918013.1 hypothetical protein [Candidatus Fervidibacter sacchari]WKU15827.1 hypothetical protein Q2T83_16020 [Candidatus Fervidibacter sacchari]